MRVRIVPDNEMSRHIPSLDRKLTARSLADLCNNVAGRQPYGPFGWQPKQLLQLVSDDGAVLAEGNALLEAIGEARERGLLWREIVEALALRFADPMASQRATRSLRSS